MRNALLAAVESGVDQQGGVEDRVLVVVGAQVFAFSSFDLSEIAGLYGECPT